MRYVDRVRKARRCGIAGAGAIIAAANNNRRDYEEAVDSKEIDHGRNGTAKSGSRVTTYAVIEN